MLGAESLMPAPAPAPTANPAGRRFLSPGGEEEAPVAPRVKLGGTLFERMQNATRNAGGRAAEDDTREPGDVPRFLHRQNNQ